MFFSETYYKKYEELNADVLEKEVDDGEYILQDLVGDGELTENDLLEIAFNDIGVDGLKKIFWNKIGGMNYYYRRKNRLYGLSESMQ